MGGLGTPLVPSGWLEQGPRRAITPFPPTPGIHIIPPIQAPADPQTRPQSEEKPLSSPVTAAPERGMSFPTPGKLFPRPRHAP